MPTGATLSDDNRVLTIKNVQLAHAGTYGCRVRHPYGQQAYGTLTVAIEGRSFNCSSTYYTVWVTVIKLCLIYQNILKDRQIIVTST